jgi:hypothetical protein
MKRIHWGTAAGAAVAVLLGVVAVCGAYRYGRDTAHLDESKLGCGCCAGVTVCEERPQAPAPCCAEAPEPTVAPPQDVPTPAPPQDQPPLAVGTPPDVQPHGQVIYVQVQAEAVGDGATGTE